MTTDQYPLAVDLDGSLIHTDLLYECVLALLKNKPLCVLLLPFWLLKGKAFLKQKLAKEVVLDIGANIGYQTLQFAHMVNENGKVYAWEPHPSNFMLLSQNVKQNGFSNVQLFNNAVAESIYTICIVKFNYKAGLSNNGDVKMPESASDHSCNSANGELPISTMRIDSLSLERVDLVKIDVQGFELKVLKSALKLLLKFEPYIIVEFEEQQMNRLSYGTIDIVKYIREQMFYEVFLILPI
jgi:FkbM family methyltransferase